MLNEIPLEVILLILDKFKHNDDPISFYNLRYINQTFKKIIDSYQTNFTTDKMIQYPYNNILHEKMNGLCSKKTSIKTFEWFMRNNVFFSIKHVRNLIINNRYKVIKMGLKYKPFLDILFNRFYINEISLNNDIFNFNDHDSPLIVAGRYNRIEIIKLLLELNKYGNPHLKGVNSLLDISLRLNFRNLLSYIIHNHYDIIRARLDTKLGSIIKLEKCEDILFYLVMSKKIKISSRLLNLIIPKKYNDLFIYCYEKMDSFFLRNNELLKTTIKHGNYDIFNYLLSEKRVVIKNEDFSNIIINNITDNKYFIYNIINNYINRISKESTLIKICIKADIEYQLIIRLINEGFYYSYEEMELALEKKNIKLLTYLCIRFKE